MEAERNPYTPNAGAVPPVIAGRADLEKRFDVLLARILRGRSEQSMIITGLRGVGKTVLLEQFRRQAEAEEWVVIDREIGKHTEVDFRRLLAAWMHAALLRLSPKQRWSQRLAQAFGVLKSFSLSVDPEGRLSAGLDIELQPGLADQGILQQDVTDLFAAVGEAAKDHDRGIILLLDEIQFLSLPQFEALIAALHKVNQRTLPITLVGAGLPQVPELAGDAKSYAERLFVFPTIDSLTPDEARVALQEPARQEGATWQESALDAAVEQTQGYPYFLQELGYAVWLIADDNEITKRDVLLALPQYEEKLDSSFFRVRLDRATDLQRAYLRVMADLGPDPHKAADVAAAMGRTSSQIAPTRAELINMGLLYTPQHGYAAFTVPQFDRFLKRAMPTFVIPPLQRRKART
ncbi:MAG: ATP-binding protein [Propionibacteriaceae bacterium]|jgi:hypothetical protein|nr:ATP-binding protein [Propionibacteriaceae bacterium]